MLSNVGSILFSYVLDKKIAPKGANDIKLINAGKILENNKTVGQCGVPFGDLPKAIIIMHVVVQPSVTKAKTGTPILCIFSFLLQVIYLLTAESKSFELEWVVLSCIRGQNMHIPYAFFPASAKC